MVSMSLLTDWISLVSERITICITKPGLARPGRLVGSHLGVFSTPTETAVRLALGQTIPDWVS